MPVPLRLLPRLHQSGAAHASNVKDVCGTAKPGFARCFAQIRTDVHEPAHIGRAAGTAKAAAATLPAGFGPADLQSAYKLPTTGGANQTVAIVDAGDDPTAEADLAVYRSTYGLSACTTANGCFTKVNEQRHGHPAARPTRAGAWRSPSTWTWSPRPARSARSCWSRATSPPATTSATRSTPPSALGATEVSNSYGGTESSVTPAYAADYTHPGVAIVASSGDSGYGIPSRTGRVHQRDRRRRHLADQGRQRPRLD